MNRLLIPLLSFSTLASALLGQGRIEGNLHQGSIGIADALVVFNQVSPGPGSADAKLVTLFARTDARGHFVLTGVPAGGYAATAK